MRDPLPQPIGRTSAKESVAYPEPIRLAPAKLDAGDFALVSAFRAEEEVGPDRGRAVLAGGTFVEQTDQGTATGVRDSVPPPRHLF